MITLDDMQQGSIEWLIARLHRITASNMGKVLTKKGAVQKSAAANEYMLGLISALYINPVEFEQFSNMSEEWEVQKYIANFNGDSFTGNMHTERGHNLEADALKAVATKHGLTTRGVGMCIEGDDPDGIISFSPDELVQADGADVAGVEVKAPTLKKFLKYVNDDVLPSEYELQVHSSLAASGFDRWYFGAYFPGQPVFTKIVERNELTEVIRESFATLKVSYEELFKQTKANLSQLTEGLNE